ncbi:hypothetical protein [Fervidobacterium sp.]
MCDEKVQKDDKVFQLIKKLILYSSIIALLEFFIGLTLGYFSFALGVLIGDLGVIIGLLSMLKYKERFISFGRIHFRTGYMLRYVFYASLFLLAAVILKDTVQAIMGVFVAFINLKIVIFLFAWRWEL